MSAGARKALSRSRAAAAGCSRWIHSNDSCQVAATVSREVLGLALLHQLGESRSWKLRVVIDAAAALSEAPTG